MSGAQAADAPVHSELLLQTTQSWDGVRYPPYPAGQPEVSIVRWRIDPHRTLDWHAHPSINVAYVLSGQLTVTRENGQSMTVGPGMALAETVNTLHKGQSGDEPVDLIVFYAGVPGTPLTVKAPASQ